VGEGARTVMVRAIGPTLSRFGVTDALANLRLEVFDAQGARVAEAAPWNQLPAGDRVYLEEAASDVGAFALPPASTDKVLLMLLNPGVYSCVISATGPTGGSMLFEIYEVSSVQAPPPTRLGPGDGT
jgi:hypothetical protein